MKSLILDVLENRVLGWPLRLLGGLTRGRPKILGFINPFYVPRWTVERHGARLLADHDDYVARVSKDSRIVRFDPGTYEPEISYLIETLIKPDDVVLDIGANVGLHTVAFAHAAAQGHVFAFEPVDEMADKLSRNCALNGIENVTLVRCALGDAETTMDMNVNIAGKGMEGTSSLTSTVHVDAHPEWYDRRRVPVRRLDDLIGDLMPEARIGFVKIDTEGFETFIIKGGLDVLRRDRPRMILEAHTRQLAAAGKSFQWYLDTFPDYHVLVIYAPSRANPYLRLEPLDPDQPEIAVNLLLLPRLAELQGDRIDAPKPIAVED